MSSGRVRDGRPGTTTLFLLFFLFFCPGRRGGVLAADLGECAPGIFWGGLISATETMSRRPAPSSLRLSLVALGGLQSRLGTRRIEFFLHPPLEPVPTAPQPADDILLPSDAENARGHQVPLQALQRGRFVIGFFPRHSEQGSLVDLALAIWTDFGDEPRGKLHEPLCRTTGAYVCCRILLKPLGHPLRETNGIQAVLDWLGFCSSVF